MNKTILISIKSKWVAKILNGEKTIEIRKTMPKCDLPIDVYIYCTKGNGLLRLNGKRSYYVKGKVVAKFTLNKVEEIKFNNNFNNYYIDRHTEENVGEITLGIASCLCHKELNDYLKEDTGYAWHISNLVIFDRPKELSEFYKRQCPLICMHKYTYYCDICSNRLTKAPQNFCYVEVEE